MKEGKIKMMQLLNKKRKLIGNKGFSLVELIIVIAIMAVLVAILAPQYFKYVENSRVQSDNTAVSELMNAVKVAVSNDTIYSKLDASQTVTVTGATGAIAITGNAATDLMGEIQSTLGLGSGTSLDIKAKAHTAASILYQITISTSGGNPTITVTKDWTT